MSERKLASIQRIASTAPIEGADRIVIANVLGWQCVTQKSNDFKPGDSCVYFEIDSLLPLDNPLFDFLKDPKRPEKTHHKLKTIRLKGKIAQGLILPLQLVKDSIPNETWAGWYSWSDGPYFQEGDDLTSILKIEKYEPEIPAQLRGLVEGSFPTFIEKTDETRIQSSPSVLTRHADKLFYATEKLDGTSCTYFYYSAADAERLGYPMTAEEKEKGHVFGVCSRSLRLKRTEGNTYWMLADKYDIERKLKAYGKPVCIQGEGYGLGIQKNTLKLNTVNFALFNVIDIETKQPLNDENVNVFCVDSNIPRVPIVVRNIRLGDHTVDSLVTMATRKSVITPDAWAEGLVFRPYVEDTDKDLSHCRLSFKAINPEFLLKHDE